MWRSGLGRQVCQEQLGDRSLSLPIADRLGSLVLAILRLGNLDGGANHVGGALLAFRAPGHLLSSRRFAERHQLLAELSPSHLGCRVALIGQSPLDVGDR